jgi:hypothetical protein
VKHAAVIQNVAALIAIAAIVSSCSQKSPDQDYLIRVNDRVITVDQFKRSVDAASEEAFPGEQNVSFENIQDLRVRVLNQLSEELMIAAHASAIGLSVDDAELTSRVDAIKADYPDDTFQETLLENAVSFESWKQKLAMRMLVEKVVEKELVDQVDITSADVATYIQNHYPDGAPDEESPDTTNQKIVRHLRHQKAEKRYPEWIESLRERYPVDVNKERWNQLAQGEQ